MDPSDEEGSRSNPSSEEISDSEDALEPGRPVWVDLRSETDEDEAPDERPTAFLRPEIGTLHHGAQVLTPDMNAHFDATLEDHVGWMEQMGADRMTADSETDEDHVPWMEQMGVDRLTTESETDEEQADLWPTAVLYSEARTLRHGVWPTGQMNTLDDRVAWMNHLELVRTVNSGVRLMPDVAPTEDHAAWMEQMEAERTAAENEWVHKKAAWRETSAQWLQLATHIAAQPPPETPPSPRMPGVYTLDKLPPECFARILDFATPASICCIGLTSKYLQLLVRRHRPAITIRVHRLDDRDVRHVAQFANLKSLTVAHRASRYAVREESVSNRRITSIAWLQALPSLQTLSMEFGFRTWLVDLPQHMPNLKRVRLVSGIICTETLAATDAPVRGFAFLEALEILMPHSNARLALDALSTDMLPSLRRLTIVGRNGSGLPLQESLVQQLALLHISDASCLPMDMACPELRMLHTPYPFNDAGRTLAQFCPNLQALALEQFCMPDANDPREDVPRIDPIERAARMTASLCLPPSLRFLHVHMRKFGYGLDACEDLLVGLERLEGLVLASRMDYGPEFWDTVASHCPNLTTFGQLFGTDDDDLSLMHAALPGVRRIFMNQSDTMLLCEQLNAASFIDAIVIAKADGMCPSHSLHSIADEGDTNVPSVRCVPHHLWQRHLDALDRATQCVQQSVRHLFTHAAVGFVDDCGPLSLLNALASPTHDRPRAG